MSRDTNGKNARLVFAFMFSIMDLKLKSGLMCPNYPQFHDMIKAFRLCEKHAVEGKPWVIKDEFARTIEVEMVDK